MAKEAEHNRVPCLVGSLPSRCKAILGTPQFRRLVAITALTLVFGTLFYWQVEGWSVGYGDLTPATMAGKVFILYVIVGIGIISGFIYLVAKDAIRRRGGR